MKTFATIILLALISIATNVCAGSKEDDISNQIYDNISHEYVDCGAYFIIVSQVIKNTKEGETADQYAKLSDMAMNYALIVAKEGRSSEMAQKVTLARYEIAVKSMIDEIDSDVSNISILSNKYAFRCKDAMENPEKMMKEWGIKILDKHYTSDN